MADNKFNQSPNIEMFDHVNNTIVQIPEDQVEQALLSNQFTLKKDTPIPVINSAGTPGTVDSSELLQALQSGFKLETAAQREERLKKQFYTTPEQQAKTGLEALASGLTFGLSKQFQTKVLKQDPEEIKAREEYNPMTALAGETAGIVAPLIATGGTSAVAKGAAEAGSLVRGASKAGQATEKAIAGLIKESGNPNIARKLIAKSLPKTAGSAVEGSLYGAGQLIDENAVGNADLNAENIIQYAGMGALLGGSAGAFFGAAETVAPLARDGVKKIVGKTASRFTDPERAAFELLGVSPAKQSKLASIRPNFGKDLVEELQKPDTIKVLQSSDDLYNTLRTQKESVGSSIGSDIKKIDEIAEMNPAMKMKKRDYYFEQANKLQSMADDLAKHGEVYKDDIVKLKNLARDYYDEFQKSSIDDTIKATEIWEKRKALDSKINWNKKILESPEIVKSLYQLRSSGNDMIFKLADDAERVLGKESVGELADRIRTNNKRFSVLKDATDFIEKKAVKDKLVSDSDVLMGLIGIGAGAPFDMSGLGLAVAGARKFAKSDLKNRLVILSNIEKANQATDKVINKSMKNYFNKIPAMTVPVSTSILLNTDLARDPITNKKPKDKMTAYGNIYKNLEYYSTNPEKLSEQITRNTSLINSAAPSTNNKVYQNLIKNINYLNSKKPGKGSKPGLLEMKKSQKFPKVSSLELAKFERYLAAAEKPLSVLEDLENGTITREGVETVKELYPSIYEKMQDIAMEHVSDKSDTLTYQQRIQLGILLDIPADESLIPENIAALQSSFMQDQEAGQDTGAGVVKPTSGAIKDMNIAEMEASSTQAFLNRRS